MNECDQVTPFVGTSLVQKSVGWSQHTMTEHRTIDEFPRSFQKRIAGLVASEINREWANKVVTSDEVLTVARTGTLDGRDFTTATVKYELAKRGVLTG